MASSGMHWSPEWLAAHNAERAKRCAVADGLADPTGCAVPKATGKYPTSKSPPRKVSELHVLERDTMPAILLALRLHPKVAWVERVNTGGAWYGDVEKRQFVRFGWSGMSDITGQLKDGRRLECECKSSDGKPTLEQMAYIELVLFHRGVAFFARSVDDVIRALAIA